MGKYVMASVSLTVSGVYCIAAIQHMDLAVFVFGLPAHIAAVFFTWNAL